MKIVLTLLPVVIDAIKMIERELPEAGQGQKKLAIVRDMIETAFQSLGTVEVTFQQVWPTIEKTISNLVSAFKDNGTFKPVDPPK